MEKPRSNPTQEPEGPNAYKDGDSESQQVQIEDEDDPPLVVDFTLSFTSPPNAGGSGQYDRHLRVAGDPVDVAKAVVWFSLPGDVAMVMLDQSIFRCPSAADSFGSYRSFAGCFTGHSVKTTRNNGGNQ